MSNHTNQECAGVGVGYWECDQHGCPDCRRIARSIEDFDQLAAWKTEREMAR